VGGAGNLHVSSVQGILSSSTVAFQPPFLASVATELFASSEHETEKPLIPKWDVTSPGQVVRMLEMQRKWASKRGSIVYSGIDCFVDNRVKGVGSYMTK
jgi:hypothetical protein